MSVNTTERAEYCWLDTKKLSTREKTFYGQVMTVLREVHLKNDKDPWVPTSYIVNVILHRSAYGAAEEKSVGRKSIRDTMYNIVKRKGANDNMSKMPPNCIVSRLKNEKSGHELSLPEYVKDEIAAAVEGMTMLFKRAVYEGNVCTWAVIRENMQQLSCFAA
jgi:hypothetical protein